jgi:hypothetical protein
MAWIKVIRPSVLLYTISFIVYLRMAKHPSRSLCLLNTLDDYG